MFRYVAQRLALSVPVFLSVATIVFLVVRELGVVSAFAILPFPGILYLTYRACLDRLVRAKGGVPF